MVVVKIVKMVSVIIQSKPCPFLRTHTEKGFGFNYTDASASLIFLTPFPPAWISLLLTVGRGSKITQI